MEKIGAMGDEGARKVVAMKEKILRLTENVVALIVKWVKISEK